MEILLDAVFLNEKETAYDYLEEMLDLPYYFGRNLDALHDSVSEIPDLTVIIKNLSAGDEFCHRIVTVFKDSCNVIIDEDQEYGGLNNVSILEDDSSDGDN